MSSPLGGASHFSRRTIERRGCLLDSSTRQELLLGLGDRARLNPRQGNIDYTDDRKFRRMTGWKKYNDAMLQYEFQLVNSTHVLPKSAGVDGLIASVYLAGQMARVSLAVIPYREFDIYWGPIEGAGTSSTRCLKRQMSHEKGSDGSRPSTTTLTFVFQVRVCGLPMECISCFASSKGASRIFGPCLCTPGFSIGHENPFDLQTGRCTITARAPAAMGNRSLLSASSGLASLFVMT